MMKENTEHCCCEGCDSSPETLLGRIGELASEYRGKEGSLISVLHMAQGIYGYLPLEVQKTVADALDLPLSEVSGVVTFYSFFSTQPRGEHTIRVCLGTASGTFKREDRRYDRGSEVHTGSGAVYRGLRSGAGDVY